MDTVLDFRNFDQRFRSGLFFSIIEGLLHGKDLKILFDQDPDTLKIQFDKAKIPNSNWTSKQLSNDLWEVFITKKSIPQHPNCCGICGNE